MYLTFYQVSIMVNDEINLHEAAMQNSLKYSVWYQLVK